MLGFSPGGSARTARAQKKDIRKGWNEMETVAGIIGVLSIASMLYLFYVLLRGGDER